MPPARSLQRPASPDGLRTWSGPGTLVHPPEEGALPEVDSHAPAASPRTSMAKLHSFTPSHSPKTASNRSLLPRPPSSMPSHGTGRLPPLQATPSAPRLAPLDLLHLAAPVSVGSSTTSTPRSGTCSCNGVYHNSTAPYSQGASMARHATACCDAPPHATSPSSLAPPAASTTPRSSGNGSPGNADELRAQVLALRGIIEQQQQQHRQQQQEWQAEVASLKAANAQLQQQAEEQAQRHTTKVVGLRRMHAAALHTLEVEHEARVGELKAEAEAAANNFIEERRMQARMLYLELSAAREYALDRDNELQRAREELGKREADLRNAEEAVRQLRALTAAPQHLIETAKAAARTAQGRAASADAFAGVLAGMCVALLATARSQAAQLAAHEQSQAASQAVVPARHHSDASLASLWGHVLALNPLYREGHDAGDGANSSDDDEEDLNAAVARAYRGSSKWLQPSLGSSELPVCMSPVLPAARASGRLSEPTHVHPRDSVLSLRGDRPTLYTCESLALPEGGSPEVGVWSEQRSPMRSQSAAYLRPRPPLEAAVRSISEDNASVSNPGRHGSDVATVATDAGSECKPVQSEGLERIDAWRHRGAGSATANKRAQQE